MVRAGALTPALSYWEREKTIKKPAEAGFLFLHQRHRSLHDINQRLRIDTEDQHQQG